MQSIVPRLLRYFILLSLVGAGLGWLHAYDRLLALLLGLLLGVKMLRIWRREGLRSSRAAILLSGGAATAFLGVCGELWGIHNGYWAYHDLDNGRHFPYWLPFAWAWAFIFLYQIEVIVISGLDLRSKSARMSVAILTAAFFPTWGEMVAINTGVWTYYWDYQLWGVPALAVVLLVVGHSSIYLAGSAICSRFDIVDPVFGRRA